MASLLANEWSAAVCLGVMPRRPWLGPCLLAWLPVVLRAMAAFAPLSPHNRNFDGPALDGFLGGLRFEEKPGAFAPLSPHHRFDGPAPQGRPRPGEALAHCQSMVGLRWPDSSGWDCRAHLLRGEVVKATLGKLRETKAGQRALGSQALASASRQGASRSGPPR